MELFCSDAFPLSQLGNQPHCSVLNSLSRLESGFREAGQDEVAAAVPKCDESITCYLSIESEADDKTSRRYLGDVRVASLRVPNQIIRQDCARQPTAESFQRLPEENSLDQPVFTVCAAIQTR